MPSTIELLKEGKTQELWQKCCGFIDLSIWEVYAHVHDSLPRYYGTNERILADVRVSVENSTHNGYRILYVGRGTGEFLIELTRKGCNIDDLIISRAVFGGGRLKDNNMRLENVECRRWDMEKGLMLYSDGVFDCILSVHALHALEEIDITLSEYFRVLKPSKGVILAEPQYPASVYPILDLTKEQLRRKLDAVGFRINNMIPANLTNSELIAAAVKPRYNFEMNGYKFISAEASEDLEKVFRLRYQVYCVELGVEPGNDSGLQRDVYDEYAVHFLALDENDKPVGTLRAVPNNPLGFPMEADFPLKDYMGANGILRAVEGSRFAIAKVLPAETRAVVGFGLIKGLIDYCREAGINDIFNTTQLKVLKRFEVTGFRPIGKPFEYPERLSGVLWVPMHCDIQEVYGNYSGTVRGYSDLP